MTTGSTPILAAAADRSVRARLIRLGERANALVKRIGPWMGPVVSIGVLAIILLQLGRIDLGKLALLMPEGPAFWVVFAIFYMTGPVSEWVIYRRLWHVPVGALVPLVRKQVANEIVFGYSGEVQFYLWAREHARLTNSPFGAVKDVAVLSALAGNVVTLAMMAYMAPLLKTLAIGSVGQALLASVAIVVAISMGILVVRRRLFSLPGWELFRIFVIHVVRIGMLLGLSAMMWHLLVPSIAAGMWLALATLRMMLSRLPLMANKEVMMAGFVALFFGRDGEVTAVMTFMASLIVGTHIVVGISTSLADVASRWRRAA
jgi:hypothetical protein